VRETGPWSGSGWVALAIALPSALCGLALIGDALRQRASLQRDAAERTPWQRMTAVQRVRALPWRVVVGALLVGWSALAVLVVLGPSLADGGVVLLALVVIVVVLGALAIIGLPVLVSVAAGADRTRIARTREEERLRVAAHLHDSVLQTLSLVQRQAHDPAAVAQLARSQERALRAWMAGRAEAAGDTLAGALEAAVQQVEAEERTEIAVTLNGDRPLDGAGEELVAAAREALRNAARHAAGAAIVVFAEIDERAVAVYVRDEGPGFDLAAVSPQRRGVRDAIIGRMAAIGGQATVETEPGEGTEVTLRLPAARNGAGPASMKTP
jgi:signal transduction histidine kinase